MPQIFQVLKCYKCFVFQIHLTKKSNKFDCKICGEKQSIKRHYGIGTAKDCRLHVQKLNSLRGEIEAKVSISNDSDDNEQEDFKISKETLGSRDYDSHKPLKQSKWSEFVDKREDIDIAKDESMFLGDSEVLLELPKKRKIKKFNIKTNTNYNLESDSMASERRFDHNSELDSFTNDEQKSTFKPLSESDNVNINKKQTQYKNVHSNKQQSPNKHTTTTFKTVSKNSKWAQFVDENIDNENTKVADHSLLKSDKIFSLCDDTDLDSVLDI